jgi:hypothetical protein
MYRQRIALVNRRIVADGATCRADPSDRSRQAPQRRDAFASFGALARPVA